MVSIGDYAFSDCSALSSISLPEAVSIGDYAFSDCSALSSIDLPKATTIGEGAFLDCSVLKTLKLTAESEIIYNYYIFNYYSQCTLYLHNDYKTANSTLADLGWKSVIYVDSDGNEVTD